MSERGLGLDGVLRSAEQELELNLAFASVFATPAGAQVLAYIRSITMGVTHGPQASDAVLRHHSGMCTLAAIIEGRTEHGRNRKPDITAAAGRARRKPAAGG